MTIDEFGQTIQAKYPQYANKSATEVGNAMLQKYPQYKTQITPTAFPKEEPGHVKQSFMQKLGSAFGAANNFVNSLPKAAEEAVASQPIRLLTSLGEGIDTTVKTGGKANVSGHTYNVPGLDPFQSFQTEANKTNNPMVPVKTALAGLDTLGTVEGGAQIAEKLPSFASELGSKVANSASEIANKTIGKAALANDLEKIKTKNTSKAIEAVNPDLNGKKLIQGYKDIVTGKRDVNSGGILKGQEIGTNKQTIDLGTRLSDLKLTKDSTKNLKVLGDALKQTEGELTPLLENDKTPIIKRGLTDSFDELRATMPREFKAIKDSKSAFEDVIDFAKQLINESEPNIKGGRNARIKFDTQAKLEYPNAFKEGTVDTKTPAGRAIKAVRDNWNHYLYNTAENGSEIQKLIGREADIFKATDNIAPKAAATQGKTKIGKFVQNHPTAAKVGGGLVGGVGLEEIGRRILR